MTAKFLLIELKFNDKAAELTFVTGHTQNVLLLKIPCVLPFIGFY